MGPSNFGESASDPNPTRADVPLDVALIAGQRGRLPTIRADPSSEPPPRRTRPASDFARLDIGAGVKRGSGAVWRWRRLGLLAYSGKPWLSQAAGCAACRAVSGSQARCHSGGGDPKCRASGRSGQLRAAATEWFAIRVAATAPSIHRVAHVRFLPLFARPSPARPWRLSPKRPGASRALRTYFDAVECSTSNAVRNRNGWRPSLGECSAIVLSDIFKELWRHRSPPTRCRGIKSLHPRLLQDRADRAFSSSLGLCVGRACRRPAGDVRRPKTRKAAATAISSCPSRSSIVAASRAKSSRWLKTPWRCRVGQPPSPPSRAPVQGRPGL